MELDHPVDDPKLPSFKQPTLRGLEDDLRRAFDCFNCLRGAKEAYLPAEPGEPPEAYRARLGRSVFTDFYRSSIQAFAGVLSKFSLVDPPASMEAVEDNIDLEGNSLTAWWTQVDAFMLRDGGVALCVDMPADRPGTAAEEAALGRRPYFLVRPRTKVLNWRVSISDGVETLERVTFLELVDEPDGDYGTKTVPYYRVVFPGGWQLFKIERNASQDLTAVLVDEGQYLGANGQPLPVCPVVWYSNDQGGFGQGELPLRQVVEHSIEHFQQRSDLREKTHKCALPVPVVIGRTPSAPGERRKPLVIGPNSVVDLDAGGSFTFAEPSASSLAEQRAQIAEVEKLIARQTLGFLYGDSHGTKTATQAGMEGAQIESTIARIAQRKTSSMQSLMAIWCLFTGEELPVGAGLQMHSSLYETPLDPQGIEQLQKLAGGVELLSQRSAIEELIRAGVVKTITSADDEIKRIQDEMPPPADSVGLNDLGSLPLPSAPPGKLSRL